MFDHPEERRLADHIDEYRARRDALIKLLGSRCQHCGGRFPKEQLEAHVLDYENWRSPGFVLILCPKCHDDESAMNI